MQKPMVRTSAAAIGLGLSIAVATSASAPAQVNNTCYEFVGAPPVTGDIMRNDQTGMHRYVLLPLKFDGSVYPVTPTYVSQFAADLETTMETNSYGRLDVETTTAWLELPQTQSYYTSHQAQLRPDILVAANAALSLPPGETVETYFDREIVFHEGQVINEGIGQRTVFMVPGAPATVAAHELGHTFRWDHANFLDAATPFPAEWNEIEYGNRFDIMGDGQSFHHFNPWFKLRVGWLDESLGEVVTVPTNSANTNYSYALRRLDLTPDTNVGPTALRVPRDGLTDTWVFYRGANGPYTPGQQPGVTITWGSRTDARPSRLLDMTPGSVEGNDPNGYPNDLYDADLAPGESVTDPATGIQYTCVAAIDAAALVTVSVGNAVSVDGVPVIDVTSPAPGVSLTGTVTYEATAYDPDCGANPTNGRGIASVKFELVPHSDALIPYLRSGAELPMGASVMTPVTDTVPPYQATFDTTTVPDTLYTLLVTATSRDGGINRVSWDHVIDNAGPSN